MLNDQDESIPVLKSLQFSMLALFLYDYLLTLPREKEVVWCQLFRISNLMYFTTRYLPLVNIVYAIAKSPLLQCEWDLPFVLSLVIVTRVGIGATLVARSYAMCSQHRIIVGFIGALGLLEVIFDSFLVPCTTSSKWVIAVAVSRLSFEACVIGLTVVQTVRNFSLRSALDDTNLAGFIMTHGILYFVAVFTLELMCIGVMQTQIKPAAQLRGSSGAFPLPVAAILISRFHLDIRRVARKSCSRSTTSAVPALTTFNFISYHLQSASDDFRFSDTNSCAPTEVFGSSSNPNISDKEKWDRTPDVFEMWQTPCQHDSAKDEMTVTTRV